MDEPNQTPIVHVSRRVADLLLKGFQENSAGPLLGDTEVYTVSAPDVDGEPGVIVMARSTNEFTCGYAVGYVHALNDARFR